LFHRLIAAVDGDGDVTTYTLNDSGDRTSLTDPLWNTTYYGWAAGLLVSVTDPLGRTTTWDYDDHRRVVTITRPAGGATGLTYDANGNPATSTDPDGRTTLTDYDNDNRLLSTTDPRGFTSGTLYDAPGDP